MVKFKAYDIKPLDGDPGCVGDECLGDKKNDGKKIENADRGNKKARIKAKKQISRLSFATRKKIILIFLGAIILFFIIIQVVSASKALIEIWPDVREVEYQVALTADQNQKEIDVIAQKIPAFMLEKEILVTREFQSPKISIGSKSKGTIRVHSKHHLPVTLVANTRFLSATEPTKQFMAVKGFTVPIKGFVDVEVVASQDGSDYNISPTTFSIPGLRNFSPPELYYNIYGKSTESMSGGKTEDVPRIDQESIIKAEEETKKEARKEISRELINLAGGEFKILSESINAEILEASPVGAKTGDQKESFLYRIKIKGNALAVKNNQLFNFILKYLDLKIQKDQDINRTKVRISNVSENIDKENVATLEVLFSAPIFSKIDEFTIKELAKSQRKKDIKKYLSEIYPFMREEPKIQFHPAFMRKAPQNLENIEIKIKFE